MKKALTKRVMLCTLMITIVIALLQNFSLAKGESTQILKLDEKEYIIYVSNLLNEKFEFAFSNSADTEKSNLEFVDSATDTENGNNIAFVDATMYDKYFKNQEKIFLWVKEGEQYKLEAEEVNLTKALNENEIQSFNEVTTKIKVEVGEKELPTETVKGVKVNRKIGTINIKDEENATYSYKIVKANEGTDANQLMNLAKQMNELDNKNMYEKLSVYSEFKELYTKLEPAVNDKNWKKVEDYMVEQPQDSKKGEQYLVWLKKDINNKSVIDVQLMSCNNDYTPSYENQEVVVKQTSKLPITYDNIVLFAIAGILFVLIIAIVILKLRNKKEQK